MKRHIALAPLSREHHGALILAQLLKRTAPAYKDLPTDPEGKAKYATWFYRNELIKHFAEEEQAVIKSIAGINDKLDRLCNEIIAEHKELRVLFESLNDTDDLVAELDKTGNTLEQHIRKEERELFPMIQELCTEDQLREIEKALSA